MAPPLTMQDVKMAYGYDCPYCRSRVGLNFGDEDWEEDVKSSLNRWLNQDTSNWPPEKIASYETAKKEVEEYFLEAEPLEQRISSLNQEQSEIKKQLNTIWHMCDDILGISSSMKGESEEIISRLERELYPHDQDAYYRD